MTQIALTIAKGGEAAYQRFLANPKAEVKAAHAVLMRAFDEFKEGRTTRAKMAREALVASIYAEATAKGATERAIEHCGYLDDAARGK